MLAPVITVSPLVKLRRKRLLPVPGRVVAQIGQKLNPDDVVAEAVLEPRHALLDIAMLLDIPRARAEKVIRCQVGTVVDKGTVLAGPVGLLRSDVRAPERARVVVVGDGKILLQLETTPFELRAEYPGEVVEVIEKRGVIIENTGGLIQGVWGNGRSAFGLLRLVADNAQQALTLEQMDVSRRGEIVFAAYCEAADVLDMAAEIGLRGLILGSLDAALVSKARQVPFPVLVLTGFGRRPLDERTYRLLASFNDREVLARAVPYNPITGERPEIFAPAAAGREVELPSVVDYWRPGLDVRVTGGPYDAQVGELVTLLPGLTAMPSGVRVPAALVRLADQQTAAVPLSNLYVLA